MDSATLYLILNATWQTLYMVIIAGVVAVVLGLPVGILLVLMRPQHLWSAPKFHRLLSLLINALRSIPFIILLVAIIPFTRFIVGTSIGTTAAIVPLSLCAFPFVARITENAIDELSAGLIEASLAMGASTGQIVWHFLLPEALPSLIRGITLMLVTLVGYSAMAGAIGGGGLGDVAIQYGYERFEIKVMIITVILLVVMVQLLQWLGDWLANYFRR